MRRHAWWLRQTLCAALALAAVAAAANAQTFEWKDVQGRVQSSDELPAAGTFTALRVLKESAAPTPYVRRTIELINQHARESQDGLQHEEISAPQAVGPEDTGTVAATISTSTPATENVRDPCLLSWDPRCVEKHAADYDPRLGYAPSVLRRAAVPHQSAAEPTTKLPQP